MAKVMISLWDEHRAVARWIQQFPVADRDAALNDVAYELSTAPVSHYRVNGAYYGPVLKSPAVTMLVDHEVRTAFDAYLARGLIATKSIPLAHIIMEEGNVRGEHGFFDVLKAMESGNLTTDHALIEGHTILGHADRIIPRMANRWLCRNDPK